MRIHLASTAEVDAAAPGCSARLELDHADCPAPGRPAPVMQQQSVQLSGCVANVWPSQPELDAARGHVFGPGTAEKSSGEVVE